MFVPKPVLFFILFLCISSQVFSQIYSEKIAHADMLPEEPVNTVFTFDALKDLQYLEEELKIHKGTEHRNHHLGDEVALRMHLFMQKYTYESAPAPGAFTGQKVIRKPIIYNSILKIENHVKKQVRKSRISPEEGEFVMNRCLEYAIVLLHENTGQLEQTLKKQKSAQQLIRVMERIELK